MTPEIKPMTVDDYLNVVDYSDDPNYVPSDFALHYLAFIKMVNGAEGEENKTPVIHLKMLDTLIKEQDTANLLFRGAGKTAVFGEYMFPYLAVYGELPGLKVDVALYVTDSIENGVKNMRKNLEHRWENSAFLQEYIPSIRFTDIRWEFTNIDGHNLIVKGYGAITGVRGAKEKGKRPQFALLDDLLSDEDARSPTVIARIEDTVYKAIDNALHPTKRKVIWNGTPFNQRDPLYKAIGSGGWAVNVFPVCEKFPCTREEFRGAWPDRFSYDAVKRAYDKAVANGKADAFNQELMLRIMSQEDKLILPSDLVWYSRELVLLNKHNFNFYITTDLATSEKKSADFSVVSVWAYNSNGDWLLVDGFRERCLVDKAIEQIFRFVQIYQPQGVGIEVSGQQGGFVTWIQNEMIRKNTWFTLTSSRNSALPGIRPVADKFSRFMTVSPLFKARKIMLPNELKEDPFLVAMMEELSLVSRNGFKSKHDDLCSSGDTLINVYVNGVVTVKRFDELKNGDLVEGYDEATKEFRWVAVEGFMQTGVKTTYTIKDHVDNSIHLTNNHPILTQRGWVNVGDLVKGDSIICKSTDTVIRGLKRRVGTISLQLISLMELGIGYIKRCIPEKWEN